MVTSFMLVLKPAVSPVQGEICAWSRMHRLNPDDTNNVYIFPWLRLIAAVTFERNAKGQHFVRDGDIAWHWTFRRLRLPPAQEWFHVNSQ